MITRICNTCLLSKPLKRFALELIMSKKTIIILLIIAGVGIYIRGWQDGRINALDLAYRVYKKNASTKW